MSTLPPLPNHVRLQPVVRALLIGVAWTALLGASLSWAWREEGNRSRELAETAAKAQLQKDLAFRRWATELGGLYVPVTPETPPNPYMAMVPDRDAVTASGKSITLYNPAIVLRMLMATQSELYGIKARITGEQVFNPVNAPDEWERKALDVVKRTLEDYSEITTLDGVPVLRRMQPMIMEEGCLKCHAWTGIKVGELRGATDVAIPLEPYHKLRDEAQRLFLLTHAGLWLAGIFFLVIFTIRRVSVLSEKFRQDEVLRKLNRAVENSASGILITDAQGNIEYVNDRMCEISRYDREQLLGQNPRILKSSETDQSVYQSMWQTLNSGHEWRGELKNRTRDGEVIWCMESISAMKDEQGRVTNYVAVVENVSERKFAESTIERLAFYDPLTDLPNRRLLQQRLHTGMARSLRSDKPMALLYLDLDRFKLINDTMGHSAGDAVLKETARRLQSVLRETDLLARLGGDEFAILIEDFANTDQISHLANRLLAELNEPISVLNKSIYITISIGISVFPNDAKDIDSLASNADAAMYTAKQSGRNTYRFFENKIGTAANERLRIENGLRQALPGNQLFVEFQPKTILATGQVYGMEVLVRWHHPEYGRIGPDQFIPIAEEINQIGAIGEWVLRSACSWTQRWLQSGYPLVVSVNVSPVQFSDRNLPSTVAAVLLDTGLPPSALELEITESALMVDPQQTASMLSALRALGVSLSIDDFGTGYSSLAHLKRFPVSTLKIDREFVRDILVDSNDRAIAGAVIALARSMNMKTVAEGVETIEQRDLLIALGCDCMQGYLVSRPVPPEVFEQLLATQFSKDSPSPDADATSQPE